MGQNKVTEGYRSYEVLVKALIFGLLASSGFVIGTATGLFTSPPRTLVAAVIAFGSGILVSALTFDLMMEAFEAGSTAYVIGGFLIGPLIYVTIDYFLERAAAESPKREGPSGRQAGRREHTGISGSGHDKRHGDPDRHNPRRHSGERGDRDRLAGRRAWASY
jgi:zinc transporter ZupT